ncbi:hypothetical protein ORV05_01200 [Amycolatopsis cynarae]|uniref:DUF4384 domain-containing protein n=1 Tax=Amycolatopsis cynarae TaxID=2995223 RepID=A0ABY7B3E0_9PSEU|nr:hypothetical protein [Amycolatopsis sp. HUAS 11-8]WAL66470.1 hypothetical protein ORV05_01200 [Amycolatopsis sp. HUAS 11-8]
MNETADLPEWRPMPEGLRDRLWDELEPQLETRASGGRFRTMRAPLAVAASVVVLAAGIAIAIPRLRGHGQGEAVTAAGSHGDVQLVNECVQASHKRLQPASNWRAGARLDVDSANGFLAIRNDEYAVLCFLKNGKGTMLMEDSGNTRDVYSRLTAARPFGYLAPSNTNYSAPEAVYFGITTSDVIAVSLVGPDNSVTPAILRDGTFLASTKSMEGNDQSASRIRATLKNGQVIEGSFR